MTETSTNVPAVRTTAEDGVPYINALGEQGREIAAWDLEPALDKVARQMASWIQNTRGPASVYNRAAYTAPENPWDQMQLARAAVENDDIVGGVADVTEGLMFQGLKWESEEADDADVFNQISRHLNLDEIVRTWHREEYTHSQVVVGLWWDQKTYRVRGRTSVDDPDAPKPVPDPLTGETPEPKKKPGRKRRKTYDVWVPSAMTFLDPLRVVPLAPTAFGDDRLAWHATAREIAVWNTMLGDDLDAAAEAYDPLMVKFFLRKVHPDELSWAEKLELQRAKIDPNRLMLFNPENVRRFCRTKTSYQRWTQLRLKSTFPLLDLKQQLMEADRVALVGAINYILLVRKGDKDKPATQDEIDNLREGFRVVAQLPVVVGDHRLTIDVIVPDQTHVLDSSRYDTLDRKIMSRCMGALTIASSGQRNESTVTVARGIARLLESRRHMMKRALEEIIARAVVEHPKNDGKFAGEPNLAFTPRTIKIDNDQSVDQAVLELRDKKELSRETVLEHFQFDQATEAQRREYEEDSGLDDIFGTQVPFSSPNMPGQPGQPGQTPQAAGRTGGRPPGGGKAPQSRQGKEKPKSQTGTGNTGRAAAKEGDDA